MYNCYSFDVRYKVTPPKKKKNGVNELHIYNAYGTSPEDAINRLDFWEEDELEKSDNLEILKVYNEKAVFEDPFSSERAVKNILANPKKAQLIVTESTLDDIDKEDLIDRINYGHPYAFIYMDTYLRDWLCEQFDI